MNIDKADSHRGDHDDGDAPAWIRQALQMISTKTWAVFLLTLASVSALAADARERGFIRKGMGGRGGGAEDRQVMPGAATLKGSSRKQPSRSPPCRSR
jgi:hypothetical protein